MKSLEEYLEEAENKCVSCGGDLIREVERYEHREGWNVKGFDKKQWLYMICSDCGYQNALHKLGVPRREDK